MRYNNKFDPRDMSASDYKVFRKLLYDYGKFSPLMVHQAGEGDGPVYEKQTAMIKAVEDFEEKHGNPSIHLSPNGDLGAYRALMLIGVW
jgi:hypothetical protein